MLTSIKTHLPAKFQIIRFILIAILSSVLLATGTVCTRNATTTLPTPTFAATPTVIQSTPPTLTPTVIPTLTSTPTPIPTTVALKVSSLDKLQQRAQRLIEAAVSHGITPILISTEHIEWPNSSLNCPKPDHLYAQVITPGYKFIFEVDGSSYSIHSDKDGKTMFLCTKSSPPPEPLPSATAETAGTPSLIEIPDQRYAVIGHTQNLKTLGWFLDDLGTKWYLDGEHSPEEIVLKIPGHTRLFYVDVTPITTHWTAQKIAMVALDSPGAVWYIGGEPNRRFSVEDIIENLHFLYTTIKAADPSARITSPSMLNFDFTCNGCGGFTSGREWLETFLKLYQQKYKTMPPIDVWAIDLYPLNWVSLPTTDAGLMIEQITSLRNYLDTFEEFHQAPIWVTELGLHWGWNDIDWSLPECNGWPHPKGQYQEDAVILYFEALFDFLENNADSYHIEKWFIFITYYDIGTCNYESYNGMSLYDSGEPGSPLTAIGQMVKNRIYQVE